MPWVYPKYYQTSSRHCRIVSPERYDLAKFEAGVRNMVPQFHQATLSALPSNEAAELMRKHGTWVEQLQARLAAGESYYRDMFEGYIDHEQGEKYLLHQLLMNLE